MKLEGIHHITAITADAQENIDFYAGVLGLRLVKKTVNQDDPSVYHLFFADEQGSAGSDLTFFEFPGAPTGPRRRRHGPRDRLARRLRGGARLLGRAARRAGHRSRSAAREPSSSPTPRASQHVLRVSHVDDEPLIAEHPEVPAELALRGFDGVRAFSSEPSRSEGLLRELGFEPAEDRFSEDAWEARGDLARRHDRLRPAAGRARACRAPAPSTTSPGHRRWRSTRPGASAPSPAARTRLR